MPRTLGRERLRELAVQGRRVRKAVGALSIERMPISVAPRPVDAPRTRTETSSVEPLNAIRNPTTVPTIATFG